MRLVCGVGINDLGWSTCKDRCTPYEVKVYTCWAHMIQRCYSSRVHRERPKYSNCRVCERWKTLSNFAEDIKKLKNYDKWLQGGYALDKDKLLGNQGIYDEEHCMFLSVGDNSSECINRCGNPRKFRNDGSAVVVEYKDGRIVEYSSGKELSRVLGVPYTTVSSGWLAGRTKGYMKYGISKIYYK